MASPDRIYGVARAVLDATAAGLTTAGCVVPERQYVADGNMVAFDCEQLVVAVDATLGHQGDVSAEYQGLSWVMAPRAVTLGIWLVRCCPTMDDDGEPPSAEAIDASAQQVLKDPTVILDHLWREHTAGRLGPCKGLAFQRWQALGPMGGLTGGVLRMNVNLTDV